MELLTKEFYQRTKLMMYQFSFKIQHKNSLSQAKFEFVLNLFEKLQKKLQD